MVDIVLHFHLVNNIYTSSCMVDNKPHVHLVDIGQNHNMFFVKIYVVDYYTW